MESLRRQRNAVESYLRQLRGKVHGGDELLVSGPCLQRAYHLRKKQSLVLPYQQSAKAALLFSFGSLLMASSLVAETCTLLAYVFS